VASLAERVLEAAHRENLWKRGDAILVALSGGPDSVALLQILCDLRDAEALRIGALHVDYNLRGEESRGDACFCRSLCRKSEVPLVVHEVSDAPQGNVQAWARRIRRDALRACAARDTYDRIALAHTADDRAETLILQLFRGAATDTMARLLPAAGEYIRPLVNIPRADVEAYLALRRLSFRLDRSNYSRRYLRNRVRHELLPLAGDIFGTDAGTALNTHTRLLALDADYLEAEADNLYARACREGNERLIRTEDLDNCHPAVQIRVLRRLALDLGVQASRAQSLRLLELVRQSPGRRIELEGRVEAERGRDRIWFYRRETRPLEMHVAVPGTQDLPDGTHLEVRHADPGTPLPDGRRVARMALPDRDWMLRTARAGDRIRPFGMAGRRLIFDVLAEAGVPRHQRSKCWVLTDGDDIYWLLGYRQAEQSRVGAARRNIFEFSWSGPE
jgi:tRNA(Ile)-lysidine synthase